ncbi:leucyl aminopeptidase [Ornithinimicrobium tianjinense]|uniref:Probable cytosol aminopeptidase n=1 Tax=Ornithinimicrobium tianjinense TaxID=1195761 RepID=A0A917BJI2_9MICO|nr:leucyl aminopeptidase [Ornithinimicrobium tianjinense]GGF44974.1 putative cytosol aminopeptidase [Ornithinimicrobium tianjinense]
MAAPDTTLRLSDDSAAQTAADALVLAVSKAADTLTLADGHDLPEEAVAHLREALTALSVEAGAEEVTRLTGVPGVAAPLVLVVGMPQAGTASRVERLRRAAGVAARALTGRSSAVFALGQASAEEAAAVAEGAALGAYAFTAHHGVGKASSAKTPLAEAVVTGVSADEAEALSAATTAVVDAVRLTRDLVNTPPNVLYPESFADLVTQRAAGSSVEAEVWDVERLTAEGCGGILGVGQGSGRGPRLVTLRYAPEGATRHLALVGKGITFDSGGLCIKPGASMVTMKMDMAGAATCAAAVLAIAELGLNVQVTAYLCLAENLTGDLAQRPGDVVTMRGGRTVEIINTDAEGRLVMADGLALASEQQPDAIVDVATLTGACIIALGDRTTGVMSNDAELRDTVTRLGNEVGDTSWALPLPEEIRPTLDTPVADLKHTGERSAGASVAATFLQEFVGARGEGEDAPRIPWAHLDIAGPAFNEKTPWGYYPKGATGAGVRTLVALARSYAS